MRMSKGWVSYIRKVATGPGLNHFYYTAITANYSKKLFPPRTASGRF